MRELYFKATTNIKNLFGKGLVTDELAAIFELVKNSYDADAKRVDIIFEKDSYGINYLNIFDNGSGMSINDIEDKWMEIGTDHKKGMMFSPIYRRPINGDKGIGRFAVDRLGSKLGLSTVCRGGKERIDLNIEWDNFENETKNIEDIKIPYSINSVRGESHGLKLSISDLRDDWTKESISKLIRNLRQFKNPLAVEDNFKIFVTAEEFEIKEYEIIVENIENVSSLWLEAEIGSDEPELLKMVINKDGIEYEEVEKIDNTFGLFKLKLYFFNRGDKVRFNNRFNTRVRDYGNVRLYMDNFRIYPYGEKSNDWLQLDRRQMQGYARFFGSRDLIGIVEITKKNNPLLIPLTSRQGLEENKSYFELKECIVNSCVRILEKYYFENFITSKNNQIKDTKIEFASAVSKLNDIAKSVKTTNPEVSKSIIESTKIIKKEQETQLKYVKDKEELVKVYSRIAQKETFLHKLIHQAMIASTDVKKAANLLIKNFNLGEEELKYLNLINDNNEIALNYMQTLRDDVAKKRTKTVVNLCQLVRRITNEQKMILKEDNIDIVLNANKDIYYQIDVGDVSTILNNLLSNSIKSLKKVNNRERKIIINMSENSKFVVIQFEDNGVGITPDERERIFDPFHSTTGSFGLGLTIIDEIVKEYNGLFELANLEKPGVCFYVKLRR